MSVLVVYREPADGQRYRNAMESVGAVVQMAEARHGLTLGDASGLLLTGGSDVNPALFSESPVPETDAPDDQRDAVEANLIDEALSRDLPLFAICRGLQMLNVHLGGSLTQHLPNVADHRKRTKDRGLTAHSVNIEPGTLLARIAGTPSWLVNSRHHQAIERLGRDLVVSARADDGIVEAVELPAHRFVLAVQWHPEDQAAGDPEQRKLFQSFIDAL